VKTVKMHRDYTFRAGPQAFIAFKGGQTYQRVTETIAVAIVAAKAGEIVKRKGASDERSEP
jgi:ABC-type enterobactin transport system permease subunit